MTQAPCLSEVPVAHDSKINADSGPPLGQERQKVASKESI